MPAHSLVLAFSLFSFSDITYTALVQYKMWGEFNNKIADKINIEQQSISYYRGTCKAKAISELATI
jgi:hypothetical protein